MRDRTKENALLDRAGDIDVRSMDITDDDEVEACVRGVVADYGRLDALINNAGAGYVGTLENHSMDTFRQVIETNLVGTVSTTKAALPHLRASQGRLITVTSVGGVVGQPFNEAYCAAKFGVEGMMESLAPVMRAFGVHVSLVEPGAIASKFIENAVADREKLFAGAGVYRHLLEGYAARTEATFSDAQTADQVAEVVLRVLADPSPAFRYQTSPEAAQFVGIKLTDLDGSKVQAVTSAWF